MRVIAEKIEQAGAPLIRLYVHDAPHYRMHVKVLQQYRVALYKAIKKTGLRMPYEGPIELSIVFVNPTSPDLANSYLATERCFDGKAMQPPYILVDDSQIQVVRHLSKMYVGETWK